MPKTTGKNKKRPLLVPGEQNILTGKQLQDMGKYVDASGFLIATTLKYTVDILPGIWVIRRLKNN